MPGRLAVVLAALLSIALASAPGEDDAVRTAAALQRAVRDVIDRAEPAVMRILVARGDPYAKPPADAPGRLGRFPSSPAEADAARRTPHLDPADKGFAPETAAAGVLISADGQVLTTEHAVRRARKLYVRGAGGGSFADILATEPRSDLAVLQLLDPPRGVTPVTLAAAGSPRRGDFVVALGHPVGRAVGPLSAFGIVAGSARGQVPPERTMRATVYDYGPILLTDLRPAGLATGSPLFDLEGRLMGLTTPLGSADRTFVTALPLDEEARRVVDSLRRGEEYEYGFLGVATRELTEEQLRLLGGPAHGVRVTEEPVAGTPAAKAGFQVGDILVAVNRRPVTASLDLLRLVAVAGAGQEVEIDYLRDRRPLRARVRLAKLPAVGSPVASRRQPAFRGLHVDDLATLLEPAEKQPLLRERVLAGLKAGGVVVTEVEGGSVAQRSGLQAGDIVTHFNERPVDSPAAFRREAGSAAGAVTLTLLGGDGREPSRTIRLD
jgi:serine protease Do